MSKVDLRQFDYKKVGTLDAEMWQAYYNHKFFSLFWLLLLLIREQVGLGWFVTVRLAYYSAWAAADYRIHRGAVSSKRVLLNITKFYRLVSAHAAEPFDYKRAAELELAWWDIHRSSDQNNKMLEQSLAQAAAVIYNMRPEPLADYAHYRAEAMLLPHHRGDRAENPTNWTQIREMTIKAWAALHARVQQ